MTELRRHIRLSWIALAAFVGMLSVVGEASACSEKSASRSCCSAMPAPNCCCETQSPSSADLAPKAAPAGSFSVPDAPCACRPGGPDAPASKPEAPSSEQRSDRDRDGNEAVDPAFEAHPTSVIVTRMPATDAPPRIPLYLRTSRLLI